MMSHTPGYEPVMVIPLKPDPQSHQPQYQPMYAVGDRLAVDCHKCTVRFVGEIPQWPNTTALGVEWDDPARGKHLGTLDDVHYFDVTHPNSGSFIKLTNRKIHHRKLFEQALSDVYLDNDAMESITWSQHKATENYGWDTHNQKMREYTQLEYLLVDNRDVLEVLTTTTFPKLRLLDLSSNLLTDFNQVLSVLPHMPHLKRLNVNGNRFNWNDFESDNNGDSTQFPQVEQLLLAATFIPTDKLDGLLRRFPNLTEVVLLFNGYSDANISVPRIKTIDLSHNQLMTIPSLQCTTLKLDHNLIVNLDPVTAKSIDLRYNHIAQWSQIDKLVGVESIRINHNPVFTNVLVDDQIAQLVARTGATQVNGVDIHDIDSLELWFIGQVHRKLIDYPNNSRWQYLLQKHKVVHHDTVYTNYPLFELIFTGEITRVKRYFHKTLVLTLYGDVATSLGKTIRDIVLWGTWGDVRSPLSDYTQVVGDLQVDTIDVKLK